MHVRGIPRFGQNLGARPESFQRLALPVEVIARAQAFSRLLKAARDSVSQQGGDPFPKRLRFRLAGHSSELIVQLGTAGSRCQRRPTQGVAAGECSERSDSELVPLISSWRE